MVSALLHLYVEQPRTSKSRHVPFYLQISYRNPDIQLLSFSPHIIRQQPRAWDRVPKNSNARQGRKVWKRYQLRPRGLLPGNPEEKVRIEEEYAAGEDQQSTGRSVKRLRNSDHASLGARQEDEGLGWRYVATMRDMAVGTPRSKLSSTSILTDESNGDHVAELLLGKPARRKSLRLSILRSAPRRANVMSPSKQTSVSPLKTQAAVSSHSPSRRSSMSPSKAQSVIQEPKTNECPMIRDSPSPKKRAYILEPIIHRSVSRRATLSPKKQVRVIVPTIHGSTNRQTSLSPKEFDYSCSTKGASEIRTSRLNFTEPQVAIQMSEEEHKEPAIVCTSEGQANGDSQIETEGEEQISVAENDTAPKCDAEPGDSQQELLSAAVPQDLDASTEDIGRADVTDPEDSVIQCLLAAVEDEEPSNVATTYAATSEVVKTSDVDDHTEQSKDDEKHLDVNIESADSADIPIEVGPAQIPYQMSDFAIEDGVQSSVTGTLGDEKDEVGREVITQDMEVFENFDRINEKAPTQSQPLIGITHESSSTQAAHIDGLATEEGNAFLTIVESPPNGETTPKITTRSLARLSDDTTMLKAFLDRAHAKKAAKDIKPSARECQTKPPHSPRRSPRKVLAEKDINSPSPRKPKELAHRPGTPPSKKLFGQNYNDAVLWEDIDELSAAPQEHQPTRRSARSKKIPVSTKVIAATTGAPSFIPVRRADGTDPMVLQKGVAQELAVLTRANTRRNKGQAKLPIFMLEELQAKVLGEVEQERSVTRSQTKEARKNVGWDEKLIYFQQNSKQSAIVQTIEEPEKPKVRRLRRLGGVNGTPAPKKRSTADIPATPPANGTPAPKRRGKMRS